MNASSTGTTTKNKREKADQEKKDSITAESKKIIEEFTRAIQILDDASSRIETRLVKLEAGGATTTASRTKFAQAKLKITAAKESLATLGDRITAVESATTTPILKRSNWKRAKDQIEMTKAKIKAAHRALIDVINSLKPGQQWLDTRKGHDKENDDHTRGTTTPQGTSTATTTH